MVDLADTVAEYIRYRYCNCQYFPGFSASAASLRGPGLTDTREVRVTTVDIRLREVLVSKG